MFNTIIESMDLREIELSGRKFTWANSLPNPTYEKLDRVLASVEWEQKFPLVTVQAPSRGFSDHTQLSATSFSTNFFMVRPPCSILRRGRECKFKSGDLLVPTQNSKAKTHQGLLSRAGE